MAAQTGTLEKLAQQLGLALQPLQVELTPSNIAPLLSELGLTFPASLSTQGQFSAAVNAANAAIGALSTGLTQLAADIAASDDAKIVQDGVKTIEAIGKTLSSFDQIGEELGKLAATLPGMNAGEVSAFASNLAVKLLGLSVMRYVEVNQPGVVTAAALLGLVDYRQRLAVDSTHPAFTTRSLHLSRIGDVLTDPTGLLKSLYSWGDSGFDGSKLFPVLGDAISVLGLPSTLKTAPASLDSVVFSLQPNAASAPPGLLSTLKFGLPAPVDLSIPLSATWSVRFQAQAATPAGVQATITPPDKASFKPPSGSLSGSLQIDLVGVGADANHPIILVGEAAGGRLQADSVAIGAALAFSWDAGANAASANFTTHLAPAGGKVVIDLSSADSFIADIVGSGLTSNVEFNLVWSPSSGASFQGSSAIDIAIPTHISLGPIDLTTLYLSLGPGGGGLQGGLAASVKASLGPLAASVDQIGLAGNFTFPDKGGNLGPANVSFSFLPPKGVGLSIDAGIVAGGGYLFIDPDRGRYAGALQLMFADFLAVSAIGIIETKMPDGSSGFSLLIIVTADFGPGIQLGFGFTLLAVGGLLGLNRSAIFQAIADGVRTNAISSVMFPTDVIANAPRIISDLEAFFPPKDGTFLIGPMAKLGWGEPTLVSLALAVIIEIPPGDFAILGILEASLPAEDLPILKLQVNFIGAFEFDKQRLWFYASLFDSHLLFITLDGSMGVLFAYGSDANFVISVGGFHPQFNPPPLPFPTPTRISIDIINESFARIHADGYFAVTTNTVQFGTHSDYFFGFDALNVQGSSSFDALIQFSPFHFIVSFSTSFSVNVFGVGAFSVGISLTLSGPGRWHASGTASISLLFFSIDVNIDVSWGDDQPAQLPPVAVMPLLTAEFQKQSNWRAVPPPSSNLLVSLRKLDPSEAQFVLHPIGALQVSQRLAPLDLTLDTFGSQKPSDANRLSLSALSPSFTKTRDIPQPFAKAQFVGLDDAAKLSEAAYEPFDSGIELAVAGNAYASGTAVTRIVRYDVTIIDTKLSPIFIFVRLFNFTGGLFRNLLRGASVAFSPLSNFRAAQTHPFEGSVSVTPEKFAVALASNNTIFHAEAASFTSVAAAHDYLTRAVNKDPNLAGTIHVLPHFELAA
jgi:hypothetical protein